MNKKTTIIVGIIIGVLLLLFIIMKVSKVEIDLLAYDDINETISNNDYSIIYYGDKSEDVTENLKNFKDYNKIEVYYSDASLDELNKSLKDYELSAEELGVYVLYIGVKPYYIMTNDLTYSEYIEQIDKYFFGIIPESEIKYINNYEDIDTYIKKVNSKKYTVTVLGSSSCHYCTLYKNVFNNVATDYNLDIYYFDSEKYDSDSYQKILDLDFTIPSSCTLTGEDTKLSADDFPKPITLITKSGKLVDCIRGEVSEDTLVEKLEKYDIISSKE